MMKQSAFSIALLSALLFGAATPISKPLLDHLTPFQLAGLLYLGAALGVVIIILRERNFKAPWHLDRRNRLRLLGAVLFGGVLGPLALLAGLNMALAASVSMWLNLEMVATAILGHFIFKDHLSRTGWIAAGGILVAAIILAAGEGLAGIQAGILVAAACLCWSIDNHLTALIDGISPAQSTFWKGLVAGSTNLLIGISLAPLGGSLASVLGGLALGTAAYGLSIVLYISSAQQLGATRSQLVFSSAPFWGVFLSIVLLGERLGWLHGIAAVIFMVSIVVLFLEKHAHHHTHAAMNHHHLHHHTDEHHQHDHQGISPTDRHSHSHDHDPLQHDHKHLPDLHHRHLHKNSNETP